MLLNWAQSNAVRYATPSERRADDRLLPPQLALSLKSQANTHFSSSRYREALDLYTASLNKNPFDPIVWSNRAAVRLKLEEYGLGVADSCAYCSLL